MKSKFVFAALFVMVFCVNAHAIKMSMPDIAADPGATVTVGVSVDNATGIAGGDIEVTYDSKILGVKAARGTALATGLSVVANPNVSGKVTFAMAGATGLKGGSGALLEIDFEVIAKSGKSPLTISSVSLFDENINDIPVTVVNGSITVQGAPPPKPRQLSIQNITADSGTTVTVGVNIDDATGIAGGDIEITYDSKILTAKAARGTALATGLSVVANTTVPGKVTFAMAGATGLKGGSGALLEMDIEVVAKSGRSPLTISSVSLFDENINDIPAAVVNGSITVREAPPPTPRKLSIADVAGNLGATIAVSVSIDSVEGVAGADIVLTYDATILSVDQAVLTNLLAGMTSVVNTNVPGKLNIAIAGATGAKAGSGPIINITFKAIASGVSEVKFESVSLFDEKTNEIPVTSATGGKVTVSGTDITATGKLIKLGVTTFMYGTHGLMDKDNKLTLALKSSTVNLDQYVDKQVTVKGKKLHDGLDGGPPLVDVTSVEVIPAGPAVVKEHKSGDPMLVLQSTFNTANSSSYTYIDVWKGSIAAKKGMFLEFQVTMFSGNPTFKGTVDLHTVGGGNLRDSGAKDQNGLSAHPNTDLSNYAKDKWYHRKISLDALDGKTIDGVMIATDSNAHKAGLFRVYVDNIQITDGESILNYIWGDASTQGAVPITGTGTANGTTFAGVKDMSSFSVTIVGVTPVTPMGKTINTWADIKK